MGVKELRDEFNNVLGPAGNCIKVLMDYDRSSGAEMMALFFSGNFADGTPFVIEGELVPPQGDLLAASRGAARKLLEQREST